MLIPPLLHSTSLVQMQRLWLESQTGLFVSGVTQAYVAVDVFGAEQVPPMQTWLDDPQLLQFPPLPPHAEAASPAAHVPDAQQPPLHVCVPEHDVVHAPVDVLQA
jgi:hypothetical protein